MRRAKRKSLLLLIFQEQFTSVFYLIVVLVISLVVFYFAPLGLLIEALKYLLPLIIVGGIIIFLNFLRAWRIYKK